MEKSVGGRSEDGEILGDWAGDGELGEEAGVGVQSEGFRGLSGDCLLRNEGLTAIVCLS